MYEQIQSWGFVCSTMGGERFDYDPKCAFKKLREIIKQKLHRHQPATKKQKMIMIIPLLRNFIVIHVSQP